MNSLALRLLPLSFFTLSTFLGAAQVLDCTVKVTHGQYYAFNGPDVGEKISLDLGAPHLTQLKFSKGGYIGTNGKAFKMELGGYPFYRLAGRSGPDRFGHFHDIIVDVIDLDGGSLESGDRAALWIRLETHKDEQMFADINRTVADCVAL